MALTTPVARYFAHRIVRSVPVAKKFAVCYPLQSMSHLVDVARNTAHFEQLYNSPHEVAKSRRRTEAWTIPQLRSLGVKDGWVLSTGCGNGVDVATLREHGYEAWGIDLYPCACPWCKLASATDVPFADGSFSAVLSLEVIEHVPIAERQRYAGEILRVLRPGGVLILSTPNRYFPADEHGNPVRLHSPFEKFTLSCGELEKLFVLRANTLPWDGYAAFENYPIGRYLRPVLKVFDSKWLHRSPLNPHLFLAFTKI